MTRLFVEQLSVIDCAYLDAQRGLVGESWIADVELEGDLDEQSMVLDFGEVKKRLKRTLDASADHTLIVPGRHRGVQMDKADGEVQIRFEAPAAGPIDHRSPAAAITVIESDQVNGDSLAAHLRPLLMQQTPPNVSAVRLHLRNEVIGGAYYHYTHGLKKHKGQCQRIAHGHRSRLHILVNGQRNPALEAGWAARWRDVYLGTREDVIHRSNGRLRFAYTAPEGRFELELPESRCDLMEADTTVERIAEHICHDVAARTPGQIEVRAYEGLMKGAIAGN